MKNKAALSNTSDSDLLSDFRRSDKEIERSLFEDWRILCWRVGVEYSLNFQQTYSVLSTIKDIIKNGFYIKNKFLGKRKFWALRNISFILKKGEVLGLIGPNGAGKSTLIRVLSGIEEADEGIFGAKGQVGSLLSLTAGFKLNLSGYENIFLKGALMGLHKEEIHQLLPSILDFCQLGDFIYAPMKSYSAGMRGRVGFAVAVNMMTDIIVLDEVFGAGDEKFREKAGNIFDHIKSGEDERILILATHNLGLLQNICTHILWLEIGIQRAFGPPSEVISAYRDAAKAN